MKNFDDMYPLIIGIIVAIILFFGFVKAIKKSMKSPVRHDTIDSRMNLREQQRHMDDIQRRQKQLMRDQKQKIRDLQRR